MHIKSIDNGINAQGRLRAYLDGKVVFECFTLELSDRGNRRGVSNIPSGVYLVKRHWSLRFGRCWKVYRADGKGEVEGRSDILIHAANYASSDKRFRSDLRGCIAFGRAFGDINKDGVPDLLESRATHEEFDKVFEGVDEFQLVIERERL